MPATPSGSVTPPSSKSPTPRGIPLWDHVKEIESSLRPEVDAVVAARKPPSRLLFSLSVMVVGLLVVLAAVEMQRRGLIISRMSRPRMLRGPGIPGFAGFVSLRHVADSWQNIGGAMGCAAVLWLAIFAIPPWRNFARRWSWIPLSLGAAGWLGAQWYVRYFL